MGLDIRNTRGSLVSVAVAWHRPDLCSSPPFRKAGWWNIGAGQTQQVLIGTLRNRYLYFYAEALDGAVWQGNVPILVSNARFELCVGDILLNSYRALFREVDTQGAGHLTIHLT